MEINVTVKQASPLVVSAEIQSSCYANVPVGQQPKQVGVICDSGISAIDVVSTCPLRKVDVTTFDPLSMQRELTDHVRQTSAHGTETDIVGKDDEQTLSNKIIDGGEV